jgi:hypothetical protein
MLFDFERFGFALANCRGHRGGGYFGCSTHLVWVTKKHEEVCGVAERRDVWFD